MKFQRKTFAALTCLIMFTAAASALTQSQVENYTETYNQQTSEIPAWLGNIIGGERINLMLESNNTTHKAYVEMSGLTISKAINDTSENATLEVNAERSAVTAVASSDQPFEELKQKLNEESISYETYSTSSEVKITIARSLADLASIFGIDIF